MANSRSGVYRILNRMNDKVYVGSSLDLGKRIHGHRLALNKGRHSNVYLQRSWNKYGEHCFKFSIIEICSPDTCVEREQFWIDWYESYLFKNGYNRSPTAGNCRGIKHGKAFREKGRKRMLGIPMKDWVKKKIAKALTGKSKSANHKKNIWKNRKGWRHSEESKKKISESLLTCGKPIGWRKGKKHTEEARLKMSKAGKGKAKSEAHKAAIKAAHLRRRERLASTHLRPE